MITAIARPRSHISRAASIAVRMGITQTNIAGRKPLIRNFLIAIEDRDLRFQIRGELGMTLAVKQIKLRVATSFAELKEAIQTEFDVVIVSQTLNRALGAEGKRSGGVCSMLIQVIAGQTKVWEVSRRILDAIQKRNG